MKKIFILTLVCLTISSYVNGQAYKSTKEMQAFKNYCIEAATAAKSQNPTMLEKCIQNYTPAQNGKDEIFIFNNTQIYYQHANQCQSFKKENTLSEISCKGHFKFLPAYIDTMLMNLETVEVNPAHILRSGNISFYYYVGAIKAKSSVQYTINGSNNIEIFAVAENCAPINLSIETDAKTAKNSQTERLKLQDYASKDKKAAQIGWIMYNNAQIAITIENPTKNDFSFIVAIKNY